MSDTEIIDRKANAEPGSSSSRNELAGMKGAAAFGQVVSILVRSPKHRLDFLSELEWTVMPAIAFEQYSIAEAKEQNSQRRFPVAAVMWALVSEEVDRRLSANPAQRPKLKPTEWRSGSIPWLIDAGGEPQAVSALLKSLVEQRFKETGLRMVTAGADKKPVAGILRVSDTAAAPNGKAGG